MTLGLEIKKLKRTGYFPVFLAGGLLAAAFPTVNMMVRSETFTAQPGDPFSILTDANWQMMTMLNILVCICGACLMYHTEYADNGAQKMDVLPVRAGSLFVMKFVITALALALMTALETAALAGCAMHWFSDYTFDLPRLLESVFFQWFVTLPTVMLMLLISSACRNMWVSLGAGVILVFTMWIFPQDNLILSLCPFSSPYQTLSMAAEHSHVPLFFGICAGETVVFGLLELVYQKIRRCTE